MDTMMTKSIVLLAALAALAAPAFADSYDSNDRNCDQRKSNKQYSYCQDQDEAGLTSSTPDFDREQRRLDEKNDSNVNGGGRGYN
jgi:type II secretory pathway pseudopilin PulG